MKVKVEMTIETGDYDGKTFIQEIHRLISDIDPSGVSRLTRFKMIGIGMGISSNDPRNIEWNDYDPQSKIV